MIEARLAMDLMVPASLGLVLVIVLGLLLFFIDEVLAIGGAGDETEGEGEAITPEVMVFIPGLGESDGSFDMSLLGLLGADMDPR